MDRIGLELRAHPRSRIVITPWSISIVPLVVIILSIMITPPAAAVVAIIVIVVVGFFVGF